MFMEEMNVNVEEEMIENLVAEEFSDTAPNHRHRAAQEVTIATFRQGPLNKVPEGIPFQPLMPSPLSSDFALSRCEVSLSKLTHSPEALV